MLCVETAISLVFCHGEGERGLSPAKLLTSLEGRAEELLLAGSKEKWAPSLSPCRSRKDRKKAATLSEEDFCL